MQQEQQWQQVQQQQQQQQQQQHQEQQQQGHSGAGSAELQQLLANVNVLLGRQCPMLQFQHISGVLWAWSQVGHPLPPPQRHTVSKAASTYNMAHSVPQHLQITLILCKERTDTCMRFIMSCCCFHGLTAGSAPFFYWFAAAAGLHSCLQATARQTVSISPLPGIGACSVTQPSQSCAHLC
jgi:hypothetical protein